MVLDSISKDVLSRAKSEDVKFINLQFTDVIGLVKSVSIPIERLSDVLDKGIWFDGSSIEGFVRICESDMVLKPDPETFRIIPWRPLDKKTARLICDVYTPDGDPFDGDPRSILKKNINEAKKIGFTYNTGPEVEFFLFKKDEKGQITTVPHDVGGYFDYSPRDMASEVRREIILALEDMGMEVEMSHHEVAPGQHEIDVKYSDALNSADNTVTLKYTIKAVAQRHGLYASFMPKPIFGINGSGMHTHQSLFKGKNNAFFDPKDKYKLSKTAYHFIAGQLKNARAMSAVIAPTVNSYKRLVPGYEAPVYICWAQINRSALIRIPRYSTGRHLSTRAELRCPDPSCNPYLAFAVMLKAGLEGIKKNEKHPKPVEEDVYEFTRSELDEKNITMLPGSLGEALNEMEKSNLVKDALGEHAYLSFIRAKKAEWDDYKIRVTPWEIDRYLEMI